MNILILSQWFDPEPNNMKALVFAKGLKDKGHTVQVLTGFPNYPTGKVFGGYRLKLYQKEVMEDILIHRVLLYPSHDSNAKKRMLNYISFVFFATLIGPWVIKGKIDVIYVYHPPATVMLPGIILRKLKKSALLLDINDLWPDTLTSTGMMNQKWILRMIDKWMNYSYKKANKINVLSAGIKKLLEQRNVPEKKIETIPVWCNENLITSDTNVDFIEKYNLHNCFISIYAGAMGRAQNLSTLIEVADRLREEIPNYKLIFIGHGTCVDEMKELVKSKNLSNVIFIPLVPPHELIPMLNAADVLLVHLKKDPLFTVTVPSKIPLYFSVGKPIVAGLEGDAATIITESKGGLVSTPEDVISIANNIIQIYKMNQVDREEMANNGKQYYVNNMSLNAGVTKFEKVMIDIREER